MPHYWVTSPEFKVIEPILDDGSGPTEYVRNCCCVDALDKDVAEVLAVQHPDMKEWVKLQRSDNRSPFTGLKVEDAKCKHGVCMCEFCDCPENEDYCEECEKELDAGLV